MGAAMSSALEVPRLPPLVGVAAARDPGFAPPFIHRPCPVCGTDDARPYVVRPDGLVASRCAGCAHVYLAEIPSAEALARFYASYAAGHKSYTPPSWRERIALALEARRDLNVKLLEENGGIDGRAVLEVGASYGRFLARLRARGAACTAVEPDAGACTALAAQGFAVLDAIPGEGRYDVAVALQVLEHLADPLATLERLRASLRPDGRLLLAVPNAGDGEALGPYWVGYRVDLEHLNYFRAIDLARLLARAGFFIEKHWETFQPLIYRPNEARAAPRPRLSRLLDRAADRLFAASTLAREGRFILTVLARRS
jgi:SAM-dependent methyltransferase